MNNIVIHINYGSHTEKRSLFEYIPDYIPEANYYNRVLERINEMLEQTQKVGILSQLKLSFWVEPFIDRLDAFSHYENGQYYIALTLPLLKVFKDTVQKTFADEDVNKCFEIKDSIKENYTNKLYICMLDYIVLHELGHIVHGHIHHSQGTNHISEFIAHNSVDQEPNCTNKRKWLQQLLEYDADTFAANILANNHLLDRWDANNIYANIDGFVFVTLATYLVFYVLFRNSGRDFAKYMHLDYDSYDHPYPGIRVFYSVKVYSDCMYDDKGINSTTKKIMDCGIEAFQIFDKAIIKWEDYYDSLYSISRTEKGMQHYLRLNNEWGDLVDKYNQISHWPINKPDFEEVSSYFLDNNGNHIERGLTYYIH